MKRNTSKKFSTNENNPVDNLIRLNKYISNAGYCSRREADKLISEGKVKVNGKVITELGAKINADDKVMIDAKILTNENLVYILLNKPRGYLTTTKDDQNRKTVMELIENKTKERVYPVGRLDRNTSGVLLFTNDGELTNLLTHPSSEISKVYSVHLNKSLSKGDYIKITQGILLEDGEIFVDEIAYTDPTDFSKIGLTIHSGRNRIVRRIFESLGYEVEKLDRAMFGILTKKDLPRGKSRFLSPKEVRILRSSVGKSKIGG